MSEILEISIAQQFKQFYQLRNPEEVWHFLEMHQYLVPLLIEAHGHIRKYFPAAALVLEYVVDPEIVDEKQLAIYIATEQGVDEAHDALEQFDHDWWLDASKQADDDLYITLEFV